MVMETSPTTSIMQMNTFKFNASATTPQHPIYFHNTNATTTISTTATAGLMETQHPQYHKSSSFPNNNNNNKNIVVEDSEISIFDAQKYFNDTSHPNPKPRSSFSPPIIPTPEHDHDHDQKATNNNINPSRLSCGSYNRVRSFHATPTASSEASWNSQTGLLSHPAGGLAVSLRNIPNANSNSNNQERTKGHSISTKWFFRRKCPCSSKKSVQVQEPAAAANSYIKSGPSNHNQELVHSQERQSISSSQQNLISPSSRPDHNFQPTTFRHQQQPRLFFRRKCPCSSKKSVQVQEPAAAANSYIKSGPSNHNQELVHSQERQSISSSQQNLISPSSRPDHNFQPTTFRHQQQPRLSSSGRPLNDIPATSVFSFPILNKLSLPAQHSSFDDPPRDSLEVFQPVEEPRKVISSNGFGFPGSPISRVAAIDDDMASDASSDLFEIESFSTQTTAYPTYRRRDSLDEAQNFNTRRITASNLYGRRSVDEPMTPSIAPTECYEPSEASIDWSVTTAEGFDRSSVTNISISASEFGEMTMARHAWPSNGNGGQGGKYKKGNGGGGGGLLMSCRHEKAVSVGPQPVRCGAGEQGEHGGGMVPLMSTFMHVGGGGGRVQNNNKNNNNSNKPPPPLARSHSARLSLAFAA